MRDLTIFAVILSMAPVQVAMTYPTDDATRVKVHKLVSDAAGCGLDWNKGTIVHCRTVKQLTACRELYNIDPRDGGYAGNGGFVLCTQADVNRMRAAYKSRGSEEDLAFGLTK